MKRITLNTEKGRHAVWIELFFDLVYVVALARLTHMIVEGHNGHTGLAEYAMYFILFVPIWWSWLGHTMYANRFATYDVIDRLLTLLQGFFAILMALSIDDVPGESSTLFAIAYACTRYSLVLMYTRIYLGNPESRKATGGFIKGFSLGASFWVISVILPEPLMYTAWVIGIIIELLTPLIIRKELKLLPVHNTHLPERFGLFALLVIGESIHGIASGAQNSEFSISLVLLIFLSYSIICSVWWLYFEVIEKVFSGKLEGAAQLSIYGHLPIYMGIGLLAAGVQRLVASNYELNELNLIFGISLLLMLVPLQLIHYQFVTHVKSKAFLLRGIAIVLSIILITTLGKYINDNINVYLMIFILSLYIYSESNYFINDTT